MLTDEYCLLRRLGSGGMGEVWEAARIKSADIVVPCAIKLLHADLTEGSRERRLFFQEAKIASQLMHSRIVKVLDVDNTRDGRPFLIMERVDGVDLRRFVSQAEAEDGRLLDLDIVTFVIGEVLAALAYAHERTVGDADGGIIHSDITPGNILISSSGEVKLTDFGIARFAATVGVLSRAVGTPRYMSPEQLCGTPQRETDIYGLGVVLHELLEGKRFLDGLTPDQFRSRVLNGPPPELTRTDVPAWLDDLRRCMLATDPRARPGAEQARAVLIEHCPDYYLAERRLASEYGRLFGRRRSGVTQLFELMASGELPIEPTQVLTSSSTAEQPIASPAPAASPPYGKLALASAAAAVLMGLLGVVMLVKLLREPAQPSSDGRMAAGEQDVAEPTPEPVVVAAPPAEPAPPAAAEAVAVPEAEAPVAEELVAEIPPTETEPATAKPKPRSKPAAVPKIGVIFVVESNLDGRIKAGNKFAVVQNRGAYLELPPGKYTVSWQAEGHTGWERQGQMTIENIAPKRYKMRLHDGKLEEAGQL